MRRHIGAAKGLLQVRYSLAAFLAAISSTRFFTSVTGICSKCVLNIRNLISVTFPP